MSRESGDHKYIFITGGVLSSLGKGIASASIGMLLQQRGYRVTIQKFDPYLNVDPGTMSPYQHGEVFVTDDGAETDLDLGHYERFLDRSLGHINNLTAGQIYHSIISKERRGDYLGGTVQVVPHVTNEIKNRIYKLSEDPEVQIIITEIGGTTGDIESLPFLEALRQFRLEVDSGNILNVHLTYIPYLKAAGELKTKPTQHSVKTLREIGLQPDMLLCRTERSLSDETRKKIALFCSVDEASVIEARDVEHIYEVPILFHEQGTDKLILRKLGLPSGGARLGAWRKMIRKMMEPEGTVRIGICGKYIELKDAYKSIFEAFSHAGIAAGVDIQVSWIDSEILEKAGPASYLDEIDGLLIPGGFGERGIEGKIVAVQYARENGLPFFGICLGLQCAVIETARNLCDFEDANSLEFNQDSKHPVIHLMASQKSIKEKGGSMRLGAWPCILSEDSQTARIYAKKTIEERHRHRYEVNTEYREKLEEAGLKFTGLSPDGDLVEIIEREDHPWFIAVQFHPEFKSRPLKVHPLFKSFIEAAISRKHSVNSESGSRDN